MNSQAQHEMILEKTHNDGAEEWSCPVCGRRMMISWQPWKKTVLEQGDIHAAHSGGKGGLKLGPVQVMQAGQAVVSSAPEPAVEDPYLDPWQRWMNEIDMDDLCNRDL